VAPRRFAYIKWDTVTSEISELKKALMLMSTTKPITRLALAGICGKDFYIL